MERNRNWQAWIALGLAALALLVALGGRGGDRNEYASRVQRGWTWQQVPVQPQQPAQPQPVQPVQPQPEQPVQPPNGWWGPQGGEIPGVVKPNLPEARGGSSHFGGLMMAACGLAFCLLPLFGLLFLGFGIWFLRSRRRGASARFYGGPPQPPYPPYPPGTPPATTPMPPSPTA
ncbi:MAG: hypothetical protein ACR2M0_12940 [Chloroflexia bacterium]